MIDHIVTWQNSTGFSTAQHQKWCWNKGNSVTKKWISSVRYAMPNATFHTFLMNDGKFYKWALRVQNLQLNKVRACMMESELNNITYKHFCTYIQGEHMKSFISVINPLTPNDPYSGRTAPLTSKRCILYIYSTNTGTEYFKHGIYSPFFPLQNAVCFIILKYLVPVLFTFYIQDVLKFKIIIPAPKG